MEGGKTVIFDLHNQIMPKAKIILIFKVYICTRYFVVAACNKTSQTGL